MSVRCIRSGCCPPDQHERPGPTRAGLHRHTTAWRTPRTELAVTEVGWDSLLMVCARSRDIWGCERYI
jgi:hypothetical protein